MWCIGSDGVPFETTENACPTGTIAYTGEPPTDDVVGGVEIGGVTGGVPSTFLDSYNDVKKEKEGKKTGSSTNTPWDPRSWRPGGTTGVLVTSPEMGRSQYAFETKDLPAGSLMALGKVGPEQYLRKPSDVPNFYALTPQDRSLFENAARKVHPLKTGSSYYDELISASYDLSTRGIYFSPQQLAAQAYGGSAAGGRAGVASGPRETVTLASEPDLRSTADAIGAEVLGRGVTEEEFQRILKRVRSAERSQPTVTTRMGGQTVTESGITAEGRKDLITDMLMQGPEAKEFTQATTMMDAFYKALSEGPRG
jgi:hypothetical protein